MTIAGTGTATRLRGLPRPSCSRSSTLTNNRDWTIARGVSTSPTPLRDTFFWAGPAASGELYQEVDLAGYRVSLVDVPHRVRCLLVGLRRLPPLDDAIALWNFANPAASLDAASELTSRCRRNGIRSAPVATLRASTTTANSTTAASSLPAPNLLRPPTSGRYQPRLDCGTGHGELYDDPAHRTHAELVLGGQRPP